MDRVNSNPIFIGGLDRSGKTYMRLMLGAHPNLVFSKRTEMWTRFYNQFGDLAGADNFERCLRTMLNQKHIQSLRLDGERLRREFRRGPKSYARLFALVHEQYAKAQGKRRWGDQTEGIERYAPPIFAAYPNARMIQMIRDPRDRFEAAVARRPRTRRQVGLFTAQWLQSAALAVKNEQRYPQQYKVVRFEAMVAQPEETLHEVCRFLGESYSPALVLMEDVARFRQPQANPFQAAQCPLSTDFIGRYRHRLETHEIAFIQQYAAEPMERFGYTLEPIQLAAADKARFYPTHWVPNRVQMVGWKAMSVRD